MGVYQIARKDANAMVPDFTAPERSTLGMFKGISFIPQSTWGLSVELQELIRRQGPSIESAALINSHWTLTLEGERLCILTSSLESSKMP